MSDAIWGATRGGPGRRISGRGPETYIMDRHSRKGLRQELQEFGIRYNHQLPAPRFEEHLRETLYYDLIAALAIDPFFPKSSPDFRKPLSKQQGSIEGAEYSEAAKGRPCGHVFGKGETVYRCRNCGMDDTCVLCQKCFKASDHNGHDVAMSINTGSGGCCDCGDVEAWRIDAHCKYHYSETPPDAVLQPVVPTDIDNNLRSTVSGVLDFVLDVMSNAKDSAKPPRLDDDTNPQLDATRSRLIGKLYDQSIDAAMEGSWSTVLWNDEKHNFDEVIDIVKRACKKPRAYGRQVASLVNDRGRATVYTGDLREAVRIATFLSRIRLGVTVRCARDVFREDMVEILLEFLQDIANLSVILPDGAKNSEIVRQIICEEICLPWRHGVSMPVVAEKDDRPTVPMEDSESEDEDDVEEEDRENNGTGQEDLEMLDAQDDFITEAREPELHPDIAAHLVQMTNQQRQVLLAAHNQNRIEAGLPPQTALPVPGNAGQVLVLDQTDEEGRNGLNAILELEGQLQAFEVPNNIFGNIAANTGIAIDDGEADDEFPTLFPPSLTVDTNRRQVNPDHWNAESNRFKDLGSTRLTALFLQDLKLWKMARAKLRELYITTMVAIPLFKREMGIRFAIAYKELTEAFLFADREPDQSMILFSVQIFTVPSIAEILVKDYSFITTLLAVCYTYYSQHKIGYPEEVDTNAKQLTDVYSFRSQRHYHIVNDLRYLLCTSAVQKLIPSMYNVQAQFIDWLELFQGQNPQQKALRHHVEYESDSWISAFNVTMQIAKHTQMFARTFEHAKRTAGGSSDELLRIISMCVDHLRKWNRGDNRSCRPAFEPRVPIHEFISFHHPLHWLLVGLAVHLTQKDNLDFLYASKVDADDVMKIAQYPLQVLHMTWEIRSNLWVRNGHSIRVQLYHYTDVDSREHCIDKDIQFVQMVLASVGCSNRFDGLNRAADASDYQDHLEKHNDVVLAMMKVFKNVPTADWMGEEMNLVHMQEYLFHFFITLFSERSWLLKTSNEEKIARAIRHGLIFGPKTYSEISKFVNDDRGDEACFDKVVAQLTQFTPPAGLEDVGKFVLKDSEYKHINPYHYHYTLQQIEEAMDIMNKRDTNESFALECGLDPLDAKPWNGMVDFACCQTIQDYIVKYFTCLRRSAALNAKLATSREGVTDKILYFLLLVLKEELGRRKRGASVIQGIGLPLSCTRYFLEPGLSDEPIFLPHQAKLKLLISRILELDASSSGQQKTSSKRELAVEDRETPETDFARKKANAKARQAQLMNEMKASQDAFVKKHKVDEFDLSDMDEASVDEETGISSWHYPAGNCMICQTALAANGDSYGILCCIQDSKLDRSTPQAWFCKSAVRDLLSHPLVMDQTYEWHAQGEQGLRAERYCTRDTITTCGHAMHWECYNEFFTTIRTNHRDMINQGRNLPSKIEFQCPLCKTVGNSLLPILSKSQEEIPLQKVDDWEAYNTFISHCMSEAYWQIDYYNTAESLSENMLANREFVERAEEVSALVRTPVAIRNKAVQSQSEWEQSAKCFADIDSALIEYTNITSWTQGCSGPSDPQMPWMTNIAALASSVVDIEVALRDRVHNDNSTTSIVTLIDGMSDQNLVSLRAQAGRIRGALALHYYGLADAKTTGSLQTNPQIHNRLLWRHSQIFKDTTVHRPLDENGVPLDITILQEDIFYVFVELCMIYVQPGDVNKFANLFLELELVKACTIFADSIWHTSQDSNTAIPVDVISPADFEAVGIMQEWMSRLRVLGDKRPLSDESCLSLYKVLQRYALAFIRKYCIFAHSVFGFKVGYNAEIDDDNELDKLSRIFGLRTVLDIFRCSNSPIDQTKRGLQLGWAQTLWQRGHIGTDLKWPLPVTMARLPKSLDELFEKCLKFICRRCKTTPTAPAMCLLCGELVCFQSQCCWDEDLNAGECTTHRADCGGSIGLYLLIKRSALLVMRRESGGFGPSPYLDIHGEQDPELRRGKPQFLNERRYEAGIRQMYLQHQIPSWLARKAELYADMGGWETL